MASMKNTSGACATRPKRKRIEAHRNAISMSPAMFQWLPDLLIRKSTLFKIKNAKSYWRSPATVATGSQIVWLFKSLTSCSTLFLHDVDLYAEICENFIQPELEKQFTSTWLDGLSHSCSEEDLPGELLQGIQYFASRNEHETVAKICRSNDFCKLTVDDLWSGIPRRNSFGLTAMMCHTYVINKCSVVPSLVDWSSLSLISLTPYIVQQIHTITNTSNMQIEIDDIYFLTHIFLVLTDYGASPLVTDLCFSQLIFAVASKLISWTYFQIDKKTVDQATVVDAICEITGCLRLIGTSEKSANLFDLSSLEKPIRAIISTEIVSNLLSYHFKNTVSRNADELGCGWHLLWSILFACHTKKTKSRTESTEYGKFLQNVVLKHWEAEYYSSQVYHNLSIFNTKGFITFQGALLDPELNSEKILGALKLLTNYAETSGVLSKDNQEICVSPNQTYVSANELKVDSEVANSVECINAVLIKILREKLGLEIISDCLPSWNNSVFLRRKDKNCVTSLHSDTGYLREHMSQDVSSVNDLDCCINVWIPLGTVSPSSGDSCLLIVPESHMDKERWDFNDQDRIKKSRHCRKSVVPFPCNCKQECCSGNGSEVDKRQSLFAFHQGDIVILSSSCLHEARPHSNKKRPRISIDFRFKIAFPASQYRSAFTLFM